jgi:hypothetical protein
LELIITPKKSKEKNLLRNKFYIDLREPLFIVNITLTNPELIIFKFQKPSRRSGTPPHPFINNPNFKNKTQPPTQRNSSNTIFDKRPSVTNIKKLVILLEREGKQTCPS